LEVIAGKAAGMSILVEDELLIGRNAEGAGKLAEDEEISRSHARVSLSPVGLCSVEDLGSTNGTFVNGLRITGPTTVSEGDTIELGETTLAVRELPLASADQPAPQPSGVRVSQPTIAPGAKPPDLADQGVPLEPPPLAAAPAAPEEAQPAESASAAGEDAAGRAGAESAPDARPPTLSLRLEVDFAAQEALLILDDSSEPVRLLLDAGVWRAADSPQLEGGVPPG
jgi:pSer/pThr/pTyr-binding forkhead associated (FHA) protein